MAGRGTRSQLGRVVYRLYGVAYAAVLGFGFLGDLGGNRTHPVAITGRTSAAAGAAIAFVIVVAALFGRVAVALRPSPAELQYALLSPMPRQESLARPTGVTVSASIIATGMAALVLMLTSAKQFAGLSVGIQLSYVGFAAGVGLVAFAAHLLVAEGRHRVVLLVAALALVAVSVHDIITASPLSPVTLAVKALRNGAPALAVIGPFVVGGLLLWQATRDSEDIPLEMISRGSGLADQATVALAGNDLRSLLMLQRSMGSHTWRSRPHVRISARLARRFPVLGRALRGILRWRIYRWVFIVAMSAAAGALLRVHPATARTIGLCAFVMWMLGLAFNEPLAQEHDRGDRLQLLPHAKTIEYRHVAVSWSITFVWLTGVFLIALSGRVPIASTIGIAAAAASASTAAGSITFRRSWKSYSTGAAAMIGPDFGGLIIVFSVLWPALVAALCLSPWAAKDATAFDLVLPGVFVLGGVVFWIQTGGFANLMRPIIPTETTTP